MNKQELSLKLKRNYEKHSLTKTKRKITFAYHE